ncbi:nitrate- and nitrite sensing domain-containing protein [Stackebrandtia soli]|uniref:sensor histidine kinase n=1 Tax=Stackebrandtia soli TaxID=1892856 RepID=UPI0039EA6070
MRITRKLGILVAFPLIAAIAFAALAVTITASNALSAERVRGLVVVSAEAGKLAQKLRSERAAAVSALIDDTTTAVDEYQAKIDDTNRSIEAYQAARATLIQVPDVTAELLDQVDDHLEQLDTRRTEVNEREIATSTAAFAYRIVIADLLNYRDSIAEAGGATTELATDLRSAAALSQAAEYIGLQHVHVLRALDHGTLTATAKQDILLARVGYEEARMSFSGLATDEWRDLLDDSQDGSAVAGAQRMEDAVARTDVGESIDVDHKAWNIAMDGKGARLVNVQTHIDEQLVANVTQLRDGQRDAALLEIGAVVAVAAIAITLAVSLGRPVVRGLRRLRDAARHVAADELPQAVARLDDHEVLGELTPEEFASSMTPPVDITGRDELAEVGKAFNEVHHEAIRVAAQQALLRVHIASIFVSLARRGHALSGRLTEALDEAERAELDPERLDRLFRLDHLVTLLSRSNDSLLVLGGTSPAKVRTSHEPLADVLTAAQGQIEQYTRVQVGSCDIPLAVVSTSVDDVVKLLAELLDNAAQYSRDEVSLEARQSKDSVTITIRDAGIGIEPGVLDSINRRLATVSPLDLEAVRSMGLTVVGHIAHRLGVHVELRGAHPHGTIAEVVLPMSIMSSDLPDKDTTAKRPTLKAPLFTSVAPPVITPPKLRPAPATRGVGLVDTLTNIPVVNFDWRSTEAPSTTVEVSAEPAETPPSTDRQENPVTLPQREPAQTEQPEQPEQLEQTEQPEPADEPDVGDDGLPRRVPLANLEPGHLDAPNPQPQREYRDPSAVGATYAAYARGLASKRSSTLFTTEGSRTES